MAMRRRRQLCEACESAQGSPGRDGVVLCEECRGPREQSAWEFAAAVRQDFQERINIQQRTPRCGSYFVKGTVLMEF